MAGSPGTIVSIRDVARAANVSIQTVSRALRQNGYVAAHTRARIEEAVQRLGYQPNANAQALVTRASDVIGVVLPAEADLVFRNPYFADDFGGIAQAAEERGYRVL